MHVHDSVFKSPSALVLFSSCMSAVRISISDVIPFSFLSETANPHTFQQPSPESQLSADATPIFSEVTAINPSTVVPTYWNPELIRRNTFLVYVVFLNFILIEFGPTVGLIGWLACSLIIMLFLIKWPVLLIAGPISIRTRILKPGGCFVMKDCNF